jgi:hypothetical protein
MPEKTRKRRGSRLTVKKTTKSTESPWTKHVRMCMEKYGLTYGQAVQNPKCRNLYYLGHE